MYFDRLWMPSSWEVVVHPDRVACIAANGSVCDVAEELIPYEILCYILAHGTVQMKYEMQ